MHDWVCQCHCNVDLSTVIRQTCVCHMPTKKDAYQRLCCSPPGWFNTHSIYIKKFKSLSSFCSWQCRFGLQNGESRFSCDVAPLCIIVLFIISVGLFNLQTKKLMSHVMNNTCLRGCATGKSQIGLLSFLNFNINRYYTIRLRGCMADLRLCCKDMAQGRISHDDVALKGNVMHSNFKLKF